jgi:Flp pilus assembly protein TadD
LNPQSPFLHNSLGETLAELGRFHKAKTEFTNAMRLNPNFSWPHFELAKTLLKEGRDAEAIGEFRAALRLDPQNINILAYVANVLAADENPAVRNGKTALVLAIKANALADGVQPFALDALGMACAETGDFTNAIAATQKALALATATKMTGLEPLQQRLQLYQNHRPWRESFRATNAPPENLPKN